VLFEFVVFLEVVVLRAMLVAHIQNSYF